MTGSGTRLCLGVLLASTLGCASGGVGAETEASARATAAAVEEELLLGELSREEIEAAMPEWVSAQVEADVDLATAVRLADLSVDGEIVVFFGSWCSDSRRELARLWKAIDSAGGGTGVPIRYVGVDRSKAEPSESVGDLKLLYVPTFIVVRGGAEVGRIIESAPEGIEADLLRLLSGEVSGWISGRDDVPTPGGSGG